MEGSREYNWRDFSEGGEDNKEINSLRWNAYTRDKEGVIKGGFLFSVPHLKVGNVVWTCMKDKITKEEDQY